MELEDDLVMHHLHRACVGAIELRATAMTYHAWQMATLLPREWWRTLPPSWDVSMDDPEHQRWRSAASLVM